MGGLLLVLGSILEFFLANTFAFVLFGVLGKCQPKHTNVKTWLMFFSGGFFMSFAATLTPAFNAFGAYSPDPTNPAEGIMSTGFNASFGMYLQSLSSPFIHPGKTLHDIYLTPFLPLRLCIPQHVHRIPHLHHLRPPHQYLPLSGHLDPPYWLSAGRRVVLGPS
jgi:hypothetical protein